MAKRNTNEVLSRRCRATYNKRSFEWAREV